MSSTAAGMSPLHLLLALAGLFQGLQESGREVVVVAAGDTRIARSCRVRIDVDPIVDDEGDGVIHIVGDGITVDLADQHLLGARPGTDPDRFAGVGIRITGHDVVLRRARVSGFKVGIQAAEADGLVVEDCDVSGNFRQRLRSTPQRESAADWLSPHANDGGEWLANYGAGIAIARSRGITVRRCRARDGQNGLILDRVEASDVYDNDFSFLSGWGIALWRSSDNLISRNALDFCVRGYSHGVYNRGQDSAGLLLFEQCSDNVIVENSATHGGDGLFAFAGQEALGETPPPTSDFDYTRRGNNDNLIVENDFSYAAAHGLELTFSFGNQILRNRLVGNAICGIWGGYSRDTLIQENRIASNGDMAYGLERGGVNIEHGQRNAIVNNLLEDNACGVHLWWDADEHLSSTPWVLANRGESFRNEVLYNAFVRNEIDVQLRSSGVTFVYPEPAGVTANEDSLVVSEVQAIRQQTSLDYRQMGESFPVGARPQLSGREHILMTEWGPYDWEGPLLWRSKTGSTRDVYRLVGVDSVASRADPRGTRAVLNGNELTVEPIAAGVTPYDLEVVADGERLSATGVLVATTWRIYVFPWTTDPREDVELWREESTEAAALESPVLDLFFSSRAAFDLDDPRTRLALQLALRELPEDRFGTIALTELRFPPGRWTIRTLSDDGIRVWADDALLIDDWTWHVPTEHEGLLEIEEEREVRLRVEHFELTGNAVLRLEIDRAP